jgi:uncharacterized membrane protein
LIAGIFFAFSAFVMTALGRLPPQQGIAAMQSINIAVLNAGFFAAFFGTAAACLALTFVSCFRWGEPGTLSLLAGSLLYIVGTVLVTIACNVPLNNALAAVAPDSADGVDLWRRYLTQWTAWNHVRTAAAFAASAAFMLAL